MSTFQELGIPADLIQGLDELGIVTPTEVQEKAIPFLLSNGGDLVAQAQTGTGKTAAFGLPLLTKIDPKLKEIQGLVIAPTRELAKQIGKQLFRYTKYHASKIFVEVVSGGDKMDRQIAALQRPTHIVVATPGRLIELLHQKALSIAGVKHLVLDEADEMLSMGFKKELTRIITETKQRRSTWLFSATFPDAIQLLIKDCMSGKPHTLTIDRSHVVNRDIDHRFTVCARDEKMEFIAGFLRRRGEERGLIFCRTKAGAITLGKLLAKEGIPVDVLQGDLTQPERDKVMRSFKKGRFRILVATDVVARGIDVDNLAFVIHHQPPEQLEYYTHRSGRTARAGKKGVSVTLIEPRERAKIERIGRELGVHFTEI
ncbi:DEAD/DEAH box helicase [Luteolibacter sp. GHJ8]|uniref:DEAD/DEAH box helicase n=1 Tax=Luteolibacter rhizosphaerae TaxID=2989719 RepID=A0ABT3G547_9BACT|nr:DEAD/DEAH box helicase [Luteolibacter rhizosphaerae]MCW1914953.1 DEAD/DEAH box helicase [Luteolibacter rhizosphaerae]